jgi:hypothetical protein
MTNTAQRETDTVFGQLHYRDGNPQTNEGRSMYPMTLSAVYKQFVGEGTEDVPRLLAVLENELCSPVGKSRVLREELLTIFLAVRDTTIGN